MALTGIVGLSLSSPTLGLVDIQRPDLDVFLAIDEGLDELPKVRGGSDLIPFRTGRLPLPRWADSRPLVLNGWISGPATSAMAASFRAYVDTVKAVLDPTREEELVLAATLEDGSLRQISVRIANLMWGETLASGARLVSVELESLDPYWLGSYGAATLDSGLYLDDGHHLDQGAEIVVIPTSTSHLVPLTVPGTADIERVRVRFKGPSLTPIGADVDGVGFSFATGLGAGVLGQPVPWIEVDNFARTAIDQYGTNVRPYLLLGADNQHGEYIRIRPGARTIRISGKPAEVRILFIPTYQ